MLRTCIRAFSPTLVNLCFTGMRLELDSGFPPKLDWHKYLFNMKTVFLILRSSYHNWIDKFSDSLWDLEAKSWDRELTAQTKSHGQTVRVGRSDTSPKYSTEPIQYVKIAMASFALPQKLCWNHCSCVWAEALPIQYDFSAGAKDIHYSVIIAWV